MTTIVFEYTQSRTLALHRQFALSQETCTGEMEGPTTKTANNMGGGRGNAHVPDIVSNQTLHQPGTYSLQRSRLSMQGKYPALTVFSTLCCHAFKWAAEN